MIFWGRFGKQGLTSGTDRRTIDEMALGVKAPRSG